MCSVVLYYNNLWKEKGIVAVFVYNFKRILKNKKSIIAMLLLPIIVSFTVIYINYYFTIPKVCVIDKDKTIVTKELINSIKGNFKIVSVDENKIGQALSLNEANYVLVIDKGFTNKIINNEKPTVKSYYDKDGNVYKIVDNNIVTFINEVKNIAENSKQNTNSFNKNFKAFQAKNHNITYTEIGSRENQHIIFALNFLVMFMLFSSLNFSSVILIDRGKNKNLRIFAAPISIKSYTFQSILNLFLIVMFQVVMLLAVLCIMYNKLIISYIPLLFLLFSFFSLTTVAMSVFSNFIVSKSNRTSLFSSIIVVPMCMLGGCFWNNDMMPKNLQSISQLVPTTWIVKGIAKVLSGDGTLSSIYLNLIIMFLFSIVFFLMGIFTKKDIVG